MQNHDDKLQSCSQCVYNFEENLLSCCQKNSQTVVVVVNCQIFCNEINKAAKRFSRIQLKCFSISCKILSNCIQKYFVQNIDNIIYWTVLAANLEGKKSFVGEKYFHKCIKFSLFYIKTLNFLSLNNSCCTNCTLSFELQTFSFTEANSE